MNKLTITLAFLVVLLFALPASAQPELGIIGGVNFSTVSLDPEQNIDINTGTGFSAGGMFVYNFNERFSLQVEPTYMRRNVDFTATDVGESPFTNVTLEATQKATYIDVPVLMRVSFGEADVKPYLLAGPDIGFLSSSKQKFNKVIADGEDITNMFTSSELEEDVKDETRSIDLCMNFGGGVSVPVGNNHLFLEAQYSLGLINIDDTQPEPGQEDATIKSRGIQIKGGITFPIGIRH